MRIGLVGVGRIGAFHAATLKGLPAVDQVVVADADPGRAEAVAKDLELEFAPDVAALLASRPDGFVIAAATSAHAELIAAGVAAGIPTFCEKPVALDIAETERVVELVEAATVPVHIGFQRRFDAGYQAARSLYGKKSRRGSCCAKGCAPAQSPSASAETPPSADPDVAQFSRAQQAVPESIGPPFPA